jgi:transcription elongation GreA/GreB family factor
MCLRSRPVRRPATTGNAALRLHWASASKVCAARAEGDAAREAHSAAQAAQDRAAMSHASRELRYWNARRLSARVIPDPMDRTPVRFGSSVNIRREDGRQQTFRIVGEDEADPARRTISHGSPLAPSLIGKCVGDVAKLGTREVEIRDIR